MNGRTARLLRKSAERAVRKRTSSGRALIYRSPIFDAEQRTLTIRSGDTRADIERACPDVYLCLPFLEGPPNEPVRFRTRGNVDGACRTFSIVPKAVS